MSMLVDLHAEVVQHWPGTAVVEVQFFAGLVTKSIHKDVALHLILGVFPAGSANLKE
jgi:hypothetical protein